jgi:hypothetical protein
MTAFGSPTNAIPIAGDGTFDGVMMNSFSRPRIEGTFAGERMRAFDVDWGTAYGTVAIENAYADIKDVVITDAGSQILADGRFSLGYPRKDGGEEINARVRIDGRPVMDLRHAFALDDYPVDGLLSGEFHVYGAYTRPFGFGTMAIANGTAYHETFDSATASLRLEGAGVPPRQHHGRQRARTRGRGAAYVGLGQHVSVQFDAQRIPGGESSLSCSRRQPSLSGTARLHRPAAAVHSIRPRYNVHGTVRDFFIAGRRHRNGDRRTSTSPTPSWRSSSKPHRLVSRSPAPARLRSARQMDAGPVVHGVGHVSRSRICVHSIRSSLRTRRGRQRKLPRCRRAGGHRSSRRRYDGRQA